MKVLIVLSICFSSFAGLKRVYPSHWKSHILKVKSTKPFKSKKRRNKIYDLELVEYTNSNNDAPILLFIPGYFQNAYSWDLSPQNNISLIDYINKNYDFHMFSLQPNGIGRSDYVKKSLIDEIAIDDISNAVEFLKNYKKKIFVFGHSNGSISLQAYLGGLTRDGDKVIFDKEVSTQRQKHISGVGLSAGNVCMTHEGKKSSIYKIAKLGVRLGLVLRKLGWINAKVLTKRLSPTKGPFKRKSLAYHKTWEFLYHRDNVSKLAMKELYDKTLDGTSAPTLYKYSEAIDSQTCIKSASGTRLDAGHGNIITPIFHMTYEHDKMAIPAETKRDSFSKFASQNKDFIAFADQGHEDFMMNPEYHGNFAWLLNHFLNQ